MSIHFSKKKSVILLSILSLTLSDCSSKLMKIKSSTELSNEIPKEMVDKFRVEEPVVSPDVTPTVSPASPVPETIAPEVTKKSKKKKKSKEVEKDFEFPLRRSDFEPIWIGEKQVIDMSYLGMHGGDLTLEVLPLKVVNKRKVHHIKLTAESSSVFSLFYRVNDMVESFFDYDGLFSHRYHMVLDESNQNRDALELYDHEKKECYYWNRISRKDQPLEETKETKTIDRFSQDVLSSLFYVRMLPLEKEKIYRFPVVNDGKMFEVEVTNLDTENLDTPQGRRNCLKLRIIHRFQGVASPTGDSHIWLTNDDRRFIVKIEAKVKIGAIKGFLKGLKLGTPPSE